MKALRILVSLGLVLGLAACAQPQATRSETPPDAVSLVTKDEPGRAGQRTVAIPLNVTQVVVKVPTSLRVSEANVWYPIADVVWWGEPRGNRLEQVKHIFDDAAAQATADLTFGLPVVAEVEVQRFHSVTQKTRDTVGGMHSMHFMLTIRDATTGAVLDGPRLVEANVKASGGSRAVAEDYAGRTQRVVVVERLTQALHDELDTLTADPARFGLVLSSSDSLSGKLMLSAMN